MQRAVIMLLALLCCAACGRGEPPSPATLRADTTPESLIEELTQRYDLPESLLLQSAADLAALLQIKEKALLSAADASPLRRGTPASCCWCRPPPARRKRPPPPCKSGWRPSDRRFPAPRQRSLGRSSPPGSTPC